MSKDNVLKVAKFGGSSMADAGQFRKVKSIIESDPARRVIVVSAAGKRFKDDHKLTDLLYLCHAHKKYGVSCDPVFNMIADRYREICAELDLSVDIEGELNSLREEIETGISKDKLVSRGEYFSAKLMASFLGYDFLDAELWLKFNFDGTVNREQSYETLETLVGSRKVVIPGFYGAMPDGSIKVLSRGGSDVTGAYAAAALNADVYENWTDVSGILMADPRIVNEPDTIERITFNELRELSYMGASVLHEATVFPVREKNIPLNIRNTNDPSHPGTMIMDSFEDELQNDRFITGIAGRKNFACITVSKNGMSSEMGGLRRMLEICEKHEVNVEFTPTGIDSVSLVLSLDKAKSRLFSIVGDIEKELQPDNIQVAEGLSVVAAVGRRMVLKPGTSGRIFATLGQNGINIKMISQGPDELNIIVGVDNADFEKTVQVLYNSFVK